LVECWVFLLGSEAADLLLSPSTAEEIDDGSLAGEKWCSVAWVPIRLEEGFAVEVGEEQREFSLEEAWRCDEGFTLMVLKVAPVSKVWS